MRPSALRVIVTAVVAGGAFGLLTGCAATPGDEPAVTPTPTPSTAPSTGPSARQIPPSGTSDRAPLGFEVRYVDADGTFRTVAPEDFPR
jgi:hypothetical protein